VKSIVAYCNNIHDIDISKVVPPKLSDQFITNFTVSFVSFVGNSTTLFRGYLAVDYVVGGGLLEFGGEEFIPLYFHTNIIANPTPEFVNGYWFEEDICWNMGQLPVQFLILFPFQIPSNATYTGKSVVNGEACTGWLFSESFQGYNGTFQMFVSTETNAIVQIIMSDLPYVQNVVWDFFATTVGPFNPDIYNPPAMQCTSWTGAQPRPVKIIDTVLTVASLFY